MTDMIQFQNDIQDFCNIFMKVAIKNGIVHDNNIDRAVIKGRAVIKDMFTGDRFVDDRKKFMDGTMHVNDFCSIGMVAFRKDMAQ